MEIIGITTCMCGWPMQDRPEGYRCPTCGKAIGVIYADTDGNQITSEPVMSAGDELARLRSENAALREIARGMAEDWAERYEHHASYQGDGIKCKYCNEYYVPDVKSEKFMPREHAPTCPVRRLQEMG